MENKKSLERYKEDLEWSIKLEEESFTVSIQGFINVYEAERLKTLRRIISFEAGGSRCMEECFPNMHKALGSNPSTEKKIDNNNKTH